MENWQENITYGEMLDKVWDKAEAKTLQEVYYTSESYENGNMARGCFNISDKGDTWTLRWIHSVEKTAYNPNIDETDYLILSKPGKEYISEKVEEITVENLFNKLRYVKEQGLTKADLENIWRDAFTK